MPKIMIARTILDDLLVEKCSNPLMQEYLPFMLETMQERGYEIVVEEDGTALAQ